MVHRIATEAELHGDLFFAVPREEQVQRLIKPGRKGFVAILGRGDLRGWNLAGSFSQTLQSHC